MAHYAELNDANVVTRVVVVNNDESLNDYGEEDEKKGVFFCRTLFGKNTRWVQTSYNGSIRKNYASVGFTYDASRDAFIPPKPYPSWVLNENNCQWEAPLPYPTKDARYVWDEDSVSWIQDSTP